MARVPTFLFIGNSNTDGYAQLSGVSDADFRRWTGTTFSTTTYPINTTVAGVNMWTPRLPYGTPDTRNITNSTGTTVVVDGAAVAATDVDSWVYVKTATVGQGQLRKITAAAVQTWTVGAWTAPTIGGTVERWTDSHTLNGAQTSTVLTKSGTTANFGAHTGKWVVIISGTGIAQARRIASNTNTTLTLESALTIVPAAGDGIRVLSASGSVDAIASYTSTNGSFRPLTFYYDQSYTYSTGYDYPNFKSYPQIGPVLLNVGGQTLNFVPELTWQLRNYHGTPIYCIHLGIGATLLGPYMQSTGLTSFSWFVDGTHNDWHPSSASDLYEVLISYVLAAASAALVGAGNTMDVRGVFGCLAENDTTILVRANKIEENMVLLRDTMRTAISDGGYTTLAAAKIPWVMAGVGPSTNWTYSSTANTALARIAADDPYSGYVPTTGYTFITDGIHYDAAGQILLGSDFYSKWKEILTRESDATALAATRPTLSTIRTKVKRRYERNDVSNDATNTQVDMFINDALREVYNTLGDNAWFLRRMETLTTSASYPSTLNLPRTVSRILRIENSAYPGTALTYKGIGYTDQGRTQITMMDYSGGPYIVHFIANPQDLEQDADAALIPMDYLELVVMLTCKRLTEAAGNMTIAQYYAAESERLWKYVKRDCLRKDRFKNDGLTVIDSYDNWSSGSFPGALGNL